MYDLILILFFFVSVLLSCVIILQPGGGNVNISHSIDGPEKLFKCGDRNYFFTYITILLSFLFFILSLCLCNMNSNIKLNNHGVNINSILNKKNHSIVTHDIK